MLDNSDAARADPTCPDWRALWGQLVLVARWRVGSQQDAEDVASECVLRAWQKLSQDGRQIGSLAAWCRAVAVNLAAEHGRRSVVMENALCELRRRGLSEVARSPSLSECVDSLMLSLPRELDRNVLRALLGGLQRSEVSKAVGVTERTVSAACARIAEQCRRLP